MTHKHNGGPAFPFGQISETTGQPVNGFYDPGMSLRDFFAAKAMQGLIASPDTTRATPEQIVSDSYRIADEMIKAREQYNAAVISHDETEQP